jgi:tetratricopeptide (TPR) repeat protein
VRVTGQLIDATTGHHLWAERYDRVPEDLFAIQDELTDGIVGALESAVGRAETERACLKAPASLDAWEAAHRGMWHYYRFTREDFALAVPLFRRALELDPGASLPHSGIAYVRLLEALQLWAENPREAYAEAIAHGRAAIAADPFDAHGYSALGQPLALTGKHDEALVVGRKGIELHPSSALGYHALALAHVLRGEFEPSVRAIATAMRLSPADARLHVWLGTLSSAHYLARDYEKAAEVAKVAVQRVPRYPMAWRSLANALGQLGRTDEAHEALERFLALAPGYTTEQAARAAIAFRDEAVFQHYLEGLRKAGWKG